MLAIAGDDSDAKKWVAALIDELGFDAYDVGPLAEGWRYQRDTAAYAGLYSASPAGVWPPTASRQVTEECSGTGSHRRSATATWRVDTAGNGRSPCPA